MPGKQGKGHIYLIGFSGSGKSTVGKLLAARLQRRFTDVDQLIEQQTSRTIPQVFLEEGERYFRDMESACIEAVAECVRPQVVALGGGAFERSRNRRTVGQSGVSIYLSCSVAELGRRLAMSDDRPMLTVRVRAGEPPSQARKRRIKQLLERRRRRYLGATIVVATTGKSVSEVVKLIQRRLRAEA
jgi:shikimate kinase